MLRKLLMSLIIACLLVAVIAVVFYGMRVHIKEFPSYLRPIPTPVMVDLRLTNGQRIVTSLVEESPSQVVVKVGGMGVPFSREEIASMKVLGPEDLASGAYAEAAGALTARKPLVTFKAEDRLIDLDKIREDRERQEKMYKQIGKQRQQQKITEGILDKYEQHDAEVKRRVKQAEAKARAEAENQ